VPGAIAVINGNPRSYDPTTLAQSEILVVASKVRSPAMHPSPSIQDRQRSRPADAVARGLFSNLLDRALVEGFLAGRVVRRVHDVDNLRCHPACHDLEPLSQGY
jgi:hypothetical protein